MLRPGIATALAVFSLAAGFHTSVAAAPPRFIKCNTPFQTLPLMIVIQREAGGKVRDAVHQCLFFWGGHPAGAER